LAAFGRRPLPYVAPIALAGIRNPQQIRKSAASFDHLVRKRKYRQRYGEAERFGRSQIDH
jgi:hypothetical protein